MKKYPVKFCQVILTDFLLAKETILSICYDRIAKGERKILSSFYDIFACSERNILLNFYDRLAKDE